MRRGLENTIGIIQVNDDGDVEEIVEMVMKDSGEYSFHRYLEVRINVMLIVRL